MTFLRTGYVAATAALVFTICAAPASAGCVRLKTSATAVTKEISGSLAKEALYQSKLFEGRKGKGPIKLECKYLGVVTTCTAKQVACK